jgi:hypothetical protein
MNTDELVREYLERIAELERKLASCEKAVCEHAHLNDECREQCGDPVIGDEQYDLGTFAGHRCAAKAFKKALKETK